VVFDVGCLFTPVCEARMRSMMGGSGKIVGKVLFLGLWLLATIVGGGFWSKPTAYFEAILMFGLVLFGGKIIEWFRRK
jgi:hypothetical protein